MVQGVENKGFSFVNNIALEKALLKDGSEAEFKVLPTGSNIGIEKNFWTKYSIKIY